MWQSEWLALQAWEVLQEVGEAVLAVLTLASPLSMPTKAFDRLLDHGAMPGKEPSSVLDAICYTGATYLGALQQQSGCQPPSDKGLLTVISADHQHGLQVRTIACSLCHLALTLTASWNIISSII